MKPYLALIARDIRLGFLRGTAGLTTLFFFIVTASLFAIALGGAPELLKRAAAGVIWVCAILAALLSLESVFHRDAEDGTFDLLLLSPLSPFGVAGAKMAAHWLVSGLPLVLAAALVAQMLFVPAALLCTLMASLLLGTLYMSLIGGMGAILTFGARRPGLLLTLLILPLYVPMLILGTLALDAPSATPYLFLQGALTMALLPLATGVAAVSLHMNMRAS